MIKTTPIFLFIILLGLPLLANAHAFTEQELMQKYHGASETDTLVNIQNAVNDHSLNCADLPSTIIAFNCPDTQAKLDALKAKNVGQPTTTPTTTDSNQQQSGNTPPVFQQQTTSDSNSGSSNIVTILGAVIPMFFIIPILLRFIIGRDHDDSKKKSGKPHILLQISPFHKKVIKTNSSNLHDAGNLDDSLTAHDYSGKNMFNDTEVSSARQRLDNHKRRMQMSSSTRLLASFGLIKEKKK